MEEPCGGFDGTRRPFLAQPPLLRPVAWRRVSAQSRTLGLKDAQILAEPCNQLFVAALVVSAVHVFGAVSRQQCMCLVPYPGSTCRP